MGQSLPTFNAQLSPFGTRIVDLAQGGMTFFVSPNGSDTKFSGVLRTTPLKTITAALGLVVPGRGDVIACAPGDYDETVTISRLLGDMAIIGLGPKGSVRIKPSASNANGIVNNADNVTIVNVTAYVTGTGEGVINTGTRFRTFGCKLENVDGTGVSIEMTLGTTAEQAAGTKGDGADWSLVDTEIAWSAKGLLLTGSSDGLAVTQGLVSKCQFHNLGTAHIAETAAGGAQIFRNLAIEDCSFQRMEDGTEPTHYILLNTSNSNTGLVTRSSFPTAHNGGKNLVSTAVNWVSNFMTDGLSAAQPS